ncbi:hypothetical protein NW752_005479 [Fusarium irregulare]|nr:hypothetical protein NW752_005479 [Fusarium irregulare]
MTYVDDGGAILHQVYWGARQWIRQLWKHLCPEQRVGRMAAHGRMGAWALESIQEPQKTDKASGWENALKFQWLPDCSKKLELGESVESIDATIDRVIETLRVAQSNGLPPRSPEEGGDLIEQHLTDGELLRSGHIFRVQHETEEEADFFRDTINMHWVYSRVSMISC